MGNGDKLIKTELVNGVLVTRQDENSPKSDVKQAKIDEDILTLQAALDVLKGTEGVPGAWDNYKTQWTAAAGNNGAQIAAINTLIRAITPVIIDILPALLVVQRAARWLLRRVN